MPEVLDAPKPAPSPNATLTTPKPASPPPPDPRLGPVDPAPDVPDSDNEFFAVEKKMGFSEPDEPKPKEEKPTEEEEPEKIEDKPAEEKPKAKEDRTLKPKDEKGGQLRAKLETTLKELEAEKKRASEYETKLKDTKPSEEVTALSERLAAIEKERDEARAELRMAKQEVSPEFKAKWEEPFNREYAKALRVVKQLAVQEENGQVRAGLDADLAAVYHLPYKAAKEHAKKLFGEEAAEVMNFYNNLHGINDDYTNALQQEKAGWKETESKKAAEEVRHREAFKAAYSAARDGIAKKFSEYLSADPNDPEDAKAFAKGEAKWNQQPRSFEEHVTKQATIELAVKAYPKLVYQISKLKAANAELETRLKGIEASEPGSSKRKGNEAPKGEMSEEEELQALRRVR